MTRIEIMIMMMMMMKMTMITSIVNNKNNSNNNNDDDDDTEQGDCTNLQFDTIYSLHGKMRKISAHTIICF